MTQEIFNQRSGIIPIELLINKEKEQKLRIELDDNSQALLQYEIKTYLKMKQQDVAKHFNVSTAAVSRAIKNDPALKELREQIVKLVNAKKRIRRAS